MYICDRQGSHNQGGHGELCPAPRVTWLFLIKVILCKSCTQKQTEGEVTLDPDKKQNN